MKKKVLIIAGSDSSAGAGLQADLLTVSNMGLRGLTVATAVTAQNFSGVQKVFKLPLAAVKAQLQAVLKEPGIAAVKTGMIVDTAQLKLVCAVLKKRRSLKVVVDPVFDSSNGVSLVSSAARVLMRKELFPLADVITPNLDEAAVLTGLSVREVKEDIKAACVALKKTGAKAVLLKGGHLGGTLSPDYFYDGRKLVVLSARRLKTGRVHGTGCVLSSALAASLAKDGDALKAVKTARAWIRKSLKKVKASPKGDSVLF